MKPTDKVLIKTKSILDALVREGLLEKDQDGGYGPTEAGIAEAEKLIKEAFYKTLVAKNLATTGNHEEAYFLFVKNYLSSPGMSVARILCEKLYHGRLR